ncbi:MAG: alpha/beta fold hydrolase, partial [Elusimicrobia bacterium]|nr:alpha/beta fold hydrolase [Elusimicrobiota bacterium]
PKPTIVLLHETGGRKENWYSLARVMAKEGYGYMAVDFRGHGASQSPPPGLPANWRKFPAPTKASNEWNNLALDVDAAVEYLTSQNVPITSIGVGGADVGSSIGLKYAAVHNQMPFLFMLSPGMSYREILTVNAIRAYTKRPILLVVGADDNRSTRETAILYEFAKRSAGAENTQLITAEREHGTRILVVNKDIVRQILDWVESPVQSLEVPVESTGTPEGTTTSGGPDPLPSDEQLQAPGAE